MWDEQPIVIEAQIVAKPWPEVRSTMMTLIVWTIGHRVGGKYFFTVRRRGLAGGRRARGGRSRKC